MSSIGSIPVEPFPGRLEMDGKRLVSKGRYVRIQSLRGALWLNGFLCYTVALVCLTVILAFALGMLRFAPWPILRWSLMTQAIWIFLFLPAAVYGCLTMAEWLASRRNAIESVVPLTDERLHRLPEPSSLVRASIAPQEPSEQLLRTAYPVDIPIEQLVRPAH